MATLQAPRSLAAQFAPFVDVCGQTPCDGFSGGFSNVQSRAKKAINEGKGTYEAVAKLYVGDYQDRSRALRREMYEIGGWSPDDYIQVRGCMSELANQGVQQLLKTTTCLDRLSIASGMSEAHRKALKQLSLDLRECFVSLAAIKKNRLLTQGDIDRLFKVDFDGKLRALGKHLSYTKIQDLKSAQLAQTTEPPQPDVWPQLAVAKNGWSNPLPSSSPTAAVAAAPAPKSVAPVPSISACYDPLAKDDVLVDATIRECVSGAQSKVCKARLGKSTADLCRIVSSLKLDNFDHEVLAALARPTIKSFIDLVRMRAVQRLLQAHRLILGTDFAGLPPGCERFKDGINKFRSTPIPAGAKAAAEPPADIQEKAAELLQASLFVTTLQQSDGPWCISGAGIKAYPVKVEVEDKVDAGLQKISGGSGACRRFWSHDVIEGYKDRLNRLLEENPVLRAGHAFSDGIYEHFPKAKAIAEAEPGDVRGLFDAARGEVSTDLQGALTAFCEDQNPKCDPTAINPLSDPCRNTDPIETKQLKGTVPPVPGAFLLGQDDLTRDVLKEMPPEFADFHACASKLYKWDDKMDSYLTTGAGAACAIGAFTPAGPVLGPLCAVGFLGKSLASWNTDRLHAEFVTQCRKADGAVCSTSDEEAAFRDYDAAVSELRSSAAFAAFEAAGAGARGSQFISKLRGVSEDGTGFKALAGELRELEQLKDPAAFEKKMAEIEGSIGNSAGAPASPAVAKIDQAESALFSNESTPIPVEESAFTEAPPPKGTVKDLKPNPRVARAIDNPVPLPAKLKERITEISQDYKAAMTEFSGNPQKVPDSVWGKQIPADSPYRKAIDVAYKTMHDPEAMTRALDRILEDAAQVMSQSKSPRLVELAKEGKITREALVNVYVERARRLGWDKWTTVSNSCCQSLGEFKSQILSKGALFFDTKSVGQEHGIDIHVIQMIMLADELEAPANGLGKGAAKQLFEYLGKPESGNAWDVLFDAQTFEPAGAGVVGVPEKQVKILRRCLGGAGEVGFGATPKTVL